MADITRREWLAGASGGLLQAAAGARPNILFIMVDEMRWDALHCAGHPVVDTPNLDRLAKQGVRFANAYTVAPEYTHISAEERAELIRNSPAAREE